MPVTPPPAPAPRVVLHRTSEIDPERIDWIWPGIIASRRVTGLAGYPGLGKSQVAIDIAARVSTGRDWPGGVSNSKAGDAILLSAEDDPADTIVPRLIAVGADLRRVHVVTAVKESDGVERPFDLAVDLDLLEKDYDLRQVNLVVIDPVSAYLGQTRGKRMDRNQGGDVRAVQHQLARFAAKHDLAVLTVSHLNKSSGARAITRIMGSLEWAAAPRAVFLVTEEAGSGRRLFLPLKNNLAPDRVGYAFEIENKVVEGDIRTSALTWDGNPVTVTADEALAASAKGVTSGAIDFLRQVLSDGPMDQAEIVRLGKEAGFSEKNLRTARERLGVKPKKEGFGAGGKWVWVPASGATVLQLVVDNDTKKQSPLATDPPPASADEGSEDGCQGPYHDQASGVVPKQGRSNSDPERPDGGDAA